MSAALLIQERPLLMCGEMVRATLEDLKTQTRRVVKGAWHTPEGYLQSEPAGENGEWYFGCKGVPASFVARCPHGKPGDELWVREAWAEKAWSDEECRRAGCPDARRSEEVYLGANLRAIYRASYDVGLGDCGPWKPSIHMPLWASRITLEITGVRVERVQDISESNAQAEGVNRLNLTDGILPDMPPPFNKVHPLTSTYVQAYRQLWDSLNHKRGYGWNKNPWVWVIEFKRVI